MATISSPQHSRHPAGAALVAFTLLSALVPAGCATQSSTITPEKDPFEVLAMLRPTVDLGDRVVTRIPTDSADSSACPILRSVAVSDAHSHALEQLGVCDDRSRRELASYLSRFCRGRSSERVQGETLDRLHDLCHFASRQKRYASEQSAILTLRPGTWSAEWSDLDSVIAMEFMEEIEVRIVEKLSLNPSRRSLTDAELPQTTEEEQPGDASGGRSWTLRFHVNLDLDGSLQQALEPALERTWTTFGFTTREILFPGRREHGSRYAASLRGAPSEIADRLDSATRVGALLLMNMLRRTDVQQSAARDIGKALIDDIVVVDDECIVWITKWTDREAATRFAAMYEKIAPVDIVVENTEVIATVGSYSTTLDIVRWLRDQASQSEDGPCANSGSSDCSPSAQDGSAQFRCDGEFDTILVPGLLGETKHVFLLDTGCSVHFFSTELLDTLGSPVGDAMLPTGDKKHELSLFKTPPVCIGSFVLGANDLATVVDLSEFSEMHDVTVSGLLGVPFLIDKVLHMDHDEATVTISRGPVRQAYEPGWYEVPFSLEGGVPHITLLLPTGESQKFMVDTGADGPVYFAADTFEMLTQLGALSLTGNIRRAVRLMGSESGREGILRELRIGSVVVRDVRCVESTKNFIGMELLSRFNTILDFRAMRLLLQPKAAPNVHGLSFHRRGSRTLIGSVTNSGSGAKGGLRYGDVVLEIDGRPASDFSMSGLQDLMRRKKDGVLEISACRKANLFKVELRPQDP